MKRYSKTFIILNKDLENKTVQKKEYKDEFYEYWIYKEGKSSILGLDGKAVGDGNFQLSAIIACEHNSNHIKEQTNKGMLIEGLKFTNDKHGNDLSEYLSAISKPFSLA